MKKVIFEFFFVFIVFCRLAFEHFWFINSFLKQLFVIICSSKYIQVSFVKYDGTLFIISNFIFSRSFYFSSVGF